jgi:predicted nucleic acid-binding protein
VTPVLLDTGVIVALLDRSERNHNRCVSVLEDIAAPLVTCEAVIAEACYLLRRIGRAAEAVVENVARGGFRIPFALTPAAASVRKLMRKYRTVPMDFADACLVHLATQLGTGDVLTLDDDFDVYRWGKDRPFERLVRGVVS